MRRVQLAWTLLSDTVSFRNAALRFMPILLICLAIVPNAQAQTITSITNLQYPSQVALQNGVAQMTVTFTVYYNYYNIQGYLAFGILDVGSGKFVPGSGKSTPDPCQSLTGTNYVGTALCITKPGTSSGTESASFTLTFNSAQKYTLRATTYATDQSGNLITGSTRQSDFAITVTGQAQTGSTTITNLQAPPHALFQNGIAQATVTFTVGYTGLPSGGFLIFAIGIPGTGKPATGSGNSTPDPCQLPVGTNLVGTAACVATPASSSGTESAKFTLTFNSAQQYTLMAAAGILDKSGNGITQSNLNFSISVTDKAQLNITLPNSVTAAVDGANQTAGNVNISLQPGKHTISAPETVPLTTGSRLRFDRWSDGSKLASRADDLENDTNLTATYVTQYSLSLTDPSASGAGWYDAGSNATFSVTTPQPESGFFGTLGGKQTFQRWTGDSKESSPSASIQMDGPKEITAQWSVDNTQPYIILGSIAAAILVVIVVVVLMTKRKSRAPQKTRPPTEEAGPQPVPPTPVAPPKPVRAKEQAPARAGPPPGKKFCVFCGQLIPLNARFCTNIKCGKPQQ